MTVLRDTADGVLTLTLARPERRNALTEAMLDDLLAALRDAAVDPAIRCVRLTGAGSAFCAGYDLGSARDALAVHTPPPEEMAMRLSLHAQIPVLLRRMPKPTIACLRGAVAGSGVVFAAACDLRVASVTARFKLAFAGAGRCGDPGASLLLTRAIGPAAARAMFLLDTPVDAERALALGLVTEVVADNALDAHGADLARRLAAGPTGAFAAMKRNLNAAETLPLEEAIAAEAPANAIASLSYDGKEAAAAFMEKRPPVFRGY